MARHAHDRAWMKTRPDSVRPRSTHVLPQDICSFRECAIMRDPPMAISWGIFQVPFGRQDVCCFEGSWVTCPDGHDELETAPDARALLPGHTERPSHFLYSRIASSFSENRMFYCSAWSPKVDLFRSVSHRILFLRQTKID